jgi:predicted O-methyltransferase YrrM
MRTLLHCLRVLAHLDEPHTQVTSAELQVLLRYAKEATHAVVEIGTFEAKTSVALAAAASRTVYSIDPFFRGRLGLSYGEVISREVRRRSRAKNLVFLKGLSQDLAPEFDEPIGMLFIDADHSYEGLRRDWEMWTPKVRPNGIVALHDVFVAPNSPVPLGSMRFFEEQIADRSDYVLIERIGALGVLRKAAGV